MAEDLEVQGLEELFPQGVPRGEEAGLLGDDRDEVTPPRLMVCQDKTSVVLDGEAKPGDIYSQAHGAVLAQPVLVTPLCISREWVFWDGPPPDGKIAWRTNDPNDQRVLAEPESFKLKVHNWLFMIWHDEETKLAVMTLKKSSMPESQSLYSTVKAGRYPGYCQRYRMASRQDAKRLGNWLPQFRFDGYLDLEQAKLAKIWFDQFQPVIGSVNVAMEAEEEATPF